MLRKLAVIVAALLMALSAAAPAVADYSPPAASGTQATPASAAKPGTRTAQAAAAALPSSPVDQSKVPHYFGPYPNWANSPLTLADATVTITAGATQTVTVGNSLTARQYATDNAVGGANSNTPGQGPVLVVIPTPLNAGTLKDFRTYVQNDPTFGSPGNTFNAYVLRPTANVDEYSVVYDSGPKLVPAQANGVKTWPVAGSIAVQAGDVIAFYGQGIPLDVTGTDVVAYPSPAAPPATGTFLVGGVDFPLIAPRTYSFAATIVPPGTPAGAGATADAIVGANGAVTGVTITNPGHDYANATVTITGAGSGATAEAVTQTSGVVTGIAVDVNGGGYTAPVVTISGGNATTDATAHALGGVDAVAVGTNGVGYTFPTVDFDMPDDPAGVQAQGHAVCAAPYADCTGAPDNGLLEVTGIVVDNAGSGYATAPGVVIRDGTQFDPINPPANFVEAKAKSTISILSVVVDDFGAGYTGAPDVTFADTAPGTGAGAAATASTDYGAVVAINVLTPGSGYVTPGGIKKFVDTLPGLGEAAANNLGQYIPVAQPDTTTFAGADYYVIAVVQHREQMSSSLPTKGTLLREYVQLSTSVVPGKGIPLVQDNFDGTTSPVLMPDGSQAVGVDNPHYLGPTIVATKDKAVRIVFYNLLPKGAEGDLFLPTDTSLMGAGDTAGAMGAPMDSGSVIDEVRNSICTNKRVAGLDPTECYTENRATLHLHGGVTPWISDGTPHQWITPADETTGYPQGVAVQNVPDMVGASAPAGVPDCTAANDGCQTFYYTNQQSARLMFYHDHAWGITRLNVYAGEAAGYLVTDSTEQKLIAANGPLADVGLGTPLVIQDRTFVPSAEQLAGQDPTWDTSRWGGFGDLWYHHVYMPAQNPGDPSGMSAYGRWMYGPWFWPPATPQHGPIANPYYGKDPKGPDGNMGVPGSPEAADDFTTDLAVPCKLDDPTTWQYQVDPFCEPEFIPGTPNVSVGMEQFNDTPLVNGTAYPTTSLDPKAYRFRILNAANDRFWNLSWYVADSSGTEVALKASEVAAAQTDINIVPTPDETLSPKGPDWIQIGSEGGFLPTPTVVPAQPTTWITDPTRFDVGNVDKHSLLLAPAERGDVVVDFSKYAGKTLILYNDAPAAFPARVASYDYYTGGPDTGAGIVLPGYGPNTRTIMQVKIAATPPSAAFNLTALNNAFKHHTDGSGVFESSQDPIIVGQAGYNTAYGKTFASAGDCSNANGTNKCDGMLRIAQQGGQLFRFDTLRGTQVKVAIQPKAIHDEMNSAAFDEFGRMTANLGLEAVPATPAGQNIMLYPYIAPPTEVIDGTNLPTSDIKVQAISSGADGTQIWKITHNGVDTHPIHFHLFNVQLLNRVTWDNIIIPTEPSELGWKETIRVSPLEDTIVAIRAITPSVPFEIPNSIRLLNPEMPDGANLDPNGLIMDPAGNVSTVRNALVNFGWEYVYHCHILSHEEMDMMRPVIYALPPLKADGLAFDRATKTLSWNDNSITETSFDAQVSTNGGATWTTFASLQSPLDQPNVHQSRSVTYGPYDPNAIQLFRIIAKNTVGSTDPALAAYAHLTVQSVSASLTVGIVTTTTLTSTPNPSTFGQDVTFTATVSPAAATGTVTLTEGATILGTGTLAGGVATFNTSTLSVGTHTIVATYGGDASYSNSASAPVDQVVNQAASTTDLASAPNPSTFGQSVTFTATVAPAGATGSVEFFDGAASLGVVVLTAGQATLSTSTLTVGSHTITATYLGDVNYLPSTSAAVIQVVDKATSATTLVTSGSPSTYGTSVTFTATVTPTTATGDVEFFDGATSLGVVALGAGNTADLVTSTLGVGSHSITAVYNGDATNSTSTSNAVTQVVNTIPTTTAVTSSLDPSVFGDNVTFTATITPAGATGTVTFNVDGTDVLTWDLANGVPTYATAGLAIGTHPVIATYSGDATHAGSTSATLTQTVLQGTPAAPSNLAGVRVTPNQIRLTWTDNATDETGFTIQRATNAAFTTGVANIAVAANATTYLDGGRSATATYYYRILAVNGAGNSAWSNVVTVVPGGTAPNAPSDLVATAVGTSQINLTWTDNSNNETGFTIQRATNAAFTTGLANITVGVNVTSYSNVNRVPNTTYWYRVRANSGFGNSAWSNTASATTLPVIGAVPTNVTVTTPAAPAGRTSLVIAWTYTSNGAPGPVSFDVQRSSTGVGNWTTVANNITPTTFTSTGLPVNSTRYYRVRTVTPAGNSAWTVVVSGTTLP
jgi:FtsP/CotA-like multicopper oxidase with cupredoxin domain